MFVELKVVFPGEKKKHSLKKSKSLAWDPASYLM